MRRYSAASGKISSGVPSRRIIGAAVTRPSTVSSAPTAMLSTSAVCTVRAAVQSPTNRPTSRLTKGPVAPTAASAFVPTKLPTIRVSAVLYSCWNSVPNQMGRKNRSSCLGMLPVRISVCLTLFIEFLSLFCFSQPHFML